MKDGARVLGVDDASFSLEEDETLLIGVVYRGTEFIEDIKMNKVEIDGEDSTERLLELHELCNNPLQIKAVLTDGISFGGFNVLNLEKASKTLEKPVIAVTKNRPDRDNFRDTMKRTGNYEEVFESLEEPFELELEEGRIFIQFSGCSREKAEEIVRASVLQGQVPEAVRVADRIGSGVRDVIKNDQEAS